MRLFLVFLLVLLCSCTAVKKHVAAKPNILIILADDLGYRDVGFQGSKDIKTPNIDKLAASGIRFTDAHVSATSCSPSRAGLLTGRYQQRFGHENNCPPHGYGMNPSEKTMASLLKAQGYRTGLIGKWHLGDTEKYHPLNRGFDYFYGLLEGSRSYFYDASGSDKKGNAHAIVENRQQVKFGGYLTDVLGDKCIQFIEADKKKPFFAFLSFTCPHAPMHAKKEDLEKFKDSPRPKLAAMMWSMDQAIGCVISNLKKNNRLDNTIIYFLSDNGGSPANNACNWPLNGYKGNVFEGGHRVPFVISWPGKIEAGSSYNGLTSALDILPTSLSASGAKKNDQLDGVDLLPYILGEKQGSPHDKLFFKYENVAAIRLGKWKLLRISEKPLALFNTATDKGEQENLLKIHPEKLSEMLKLLEHWEAQLRQPEWPGTPYYFKLRPKTHNEILKGEGNAANTVRKMNKRK